MTAQQMTPDELAYLRELAADIANHGGLNGATMADAVAAAHSRRQAFSAEMALGDSRRVRMARTALASSIWAEVHSAAAPAHAIQRCDWIASGPAR